MAGNNDIDKFIYGYSTSVNQLEEESKILKETVNQLRNEIDRMKEPALMVCEISELLPNNHAIIKVPNGNQFFVNIASDCDKLKPGDLALAEQRNLTVIRKVQTTKRFNVEKFVIMEKPNVPWSEIGGLSKQILEIQEVVELPLKNPELFKKIGITPPRGILLYGPPGTGKTLLAKAVATSTNSTFIEIVGSELVQKFIGEGAKLIKEIFQLAKNKAPSIIFIDEIDAIAAKRIDMGTSGEREVQRTFMQLLAEIEGFKHLGDVKVVGCTNRIDILDPAVLRPGRLDRLVYVPKPDKDGVRQIFNIHRRFMSVDKSVDIEKLVGKMEDFSGAEIRAVCTEAGYFAIRAKRTKIVEKDFMQAIDKVKSEGRAEDMEFMQMFG
jgi:proteasome regulatory subunit